SLEGHATQNHVAVHDKVAEQAIKRMLKRGGTVLLEKEMPDPGEAVTRQRQGEQHQPGTFADGQRQNEDDQAGADKMQSATGAVAVFTEVVRVKLSETVETFDVFHDCDLCGCCSDCK